MPLMWAVYTPPAGVMLTLAFWIGLGNASLVVRLLFGVVGVIYITAATVTVDALLRLLSGSDERGEASDVVLQAFGVAVALALFSATFMVLRRRWVLLPAFELDSPVAPKSQFSILYILLLTAGTAVVLTLIRSSRDSLGASGGTIAGNALGFMAFATNAVCASFAALRPAPIGRSCVLVLLVAYVLGIALSFGANYDLASWIMIAFGPVISVLPTAILLGALLVVRSTGYRLLRKSAVGTSDEQPFTEAGATPLHSTEAVESAPR